jgi:hypothetical protein
MFWNLVALILQQISTQKSSDNSLPTSIWIVMATYEKQAFQ